MDPLPSDSLRSMRLNPPKAERIAAENTKSSKKEGMDVFSSDSMRSLRLNSSSDQIQELCDIVRQTAYDIHVYLGHGHLEKVYENALFHRLSKKGLRVEQQYPLTVYDEDGTVLENYVADLLVEQLLVVELKAAKTIAPEHFAQLLGYLKSSRCEHGLLINFGSYRFEMRKLALSHGGPIP